MCSTVFVPKSSTTDPSVQVGGVMAFTVGLACVLLFLSAHVCIYMLYMYTYTVLLGVVWPLGRLGCVWRM